MSTGPGPTQKADGSHDASVDDIAQLLVEDESRKTQHDSEQIIEDGLDLILETPGPVVAGSFMPPPPAPPAGATEEGDSTETTGSPANLAYDDLLAKLVLPPKAPTPEPLVLEPTTPDPQPLPAVPAAAESTPPTPPASSDSNLRITSPNLQIAPPADERTLVTDNPLLAEEQETAARERRVFPREPRPIREEMRPVQTDRFAHISAGTKTKLLYLGIGGSVALVGMFFGIVLTKLLTPTPVPQPTVIVAAPTPVPPVPPPARIEPLGAPTAPAAAAPARAQPEAIPAKEEPASAEGQAAAPAPESDNAQPKVRKANRPKVVRAPTEIPVAAAKPGAPAVATPAPAKPAKVKLPKGERADPFE